MLANRQPIVSVSVEDSDGGAFDDVVVRRTAGPHLYIQAKSSNYGNVIVDGDWLLTSRTPNGRSPLQHFFETYTDLKESGERFSLELWTNRGLDHTNPLLGELHDRKHDKIDTERMLAAGPRSVIGGERDAWAIHLEITIEELSEFLGAVRWRHTDSELVIRGRAGPLMEVAGLHSHEAAVNIGVDVVRGWVSDGLGPQTAPDVMRQITKLGLLLDHRDEASTLEPSDGMSQPASINLQALPPGCRACIESLLLVSRDDARRVASELNRPTARTPGVLAHFADNPPQWLRDANSLTWDAIVEFSAAHELPGSDALRKKAVEQGSLRGPLYRVCEALEAADDDDLEQAHELLAQIPASHPLFGVARARIHDGDRAVVDAVCEAGLHKSEKTDVALLATMILAVAHRRLGEVAQAHAVLKDAIQRFPQRAWFRLQRAALILSSAVDRSGGRIARSDVLRSAVTDALEARDRIREWRGPSGQAVATAVLALSLLNEYEQVCDLATSAPNGEATREEASHPEVVECLAEALLVLDRLEQLDKIDVDVLDASERTHLLALRAHRSGAPNAHRLMRDALEQATDDKTRLRAHHGLALFGELDEAALAQLSTADETYKDVIRAMAHLHREDYATAEHFLRPHHRNSPLHAELLARIQLGCGATEDAIETLTTAADAQGAASLYLAAARLLASEGRLDEAETLALTALGGDPAPNSELGLRLALVDIARQRGYSVRMESLARALFAKFPEAPLAAWSVVHALVGQVQPRLAWDFLVEHGIEPVDEPTARMAITVCNSAGVSEGVADVLLDIAKRFADSSEVAGAALASFLALGDQIVRTESQGTLFSSMLNSYVERFPDSEVLQAFSIESLDDLRQVVQSRSDAQAVELSLLVNRVRNGEAPYGILATVCAKPYSESLLSLAANYLTAISLDQTRREQEKATALTMLDSDIAVDTSVAVTAIRSGLPLDRLVSHFRRVCVADELVFDARATMASTSLFDTEYVGHFHKSGDITVTHVTEEERQQVRDEAVRLVEILEAWYTVPSAGLDSPFAAAVGDDNLTSERLRPWDASIRVAAQRNCALWCDDLALRTLAESAGIPTFGSYALYEAIASEGAPEGVPSFRQIKTQMLRSGIADAPLTWGELSEIAGADGDSDLPAIRFLDRPFSWTTPQSTLEWYVSRIEALATDADHNRLLELIRAACCGRGMAAGPADSEEAIGEVLAQTLNAVRLHAVDASERIPGILEASAYACMQVDPSGGLSVLRQALHVLHNRLGEQFGPNLSAGILRKLFAHATEADRNCLAAVILGTDA